MAGRRAGHPGGDGGHRPVVEADLVGAGGGGFPAAAGQRPACQDPPGPQDRCVRRGLAGGAVGAWAAAGQLRAAGGHPGAARPDPLPQAARSRPMPRKVSAFRRPWRTRASSWTRWPLMCLGSPAGRCWPPWLAGNATRWCWPSWPVGGCVPCCPSCAKRCGAGSGHHALLVGLSLAHLEHLEGAIATLDTEVDRVLAPFARPGIGWPPAPGWASGPRRPSSPRSGWT